MDMKNPDGQQRAEVFYFDSPQALVQEVCARWLELLKSQSAPFSVALSGGRIAKDLFTTAALQRNLFEPHLPRMHFFWGDERCVPPTDPESNYLLARANLLDKWAVPKANVHRFHTEANDDYLLNEANAELHRVCELNESGRPIIDLVFLGLGEDGHVASLFPAEEESWVDDPAIYRIVYGTKPPPKRVTLGYLPIIDAREVWVLVSGLGKEAALADALGCKPSNPLGRIMLRRKRTHIFSAIKPA